MADLVMADAARRLQARTAEGGADPVRVAALGCVGKRSFALLSEGLGADGAGEEASAVRMFDRSYEEAGLSIDTGAAVGLVMPAGPGTAAATLLRQAEVAQDLAAGLSCRWAAYCPDTYPHRPERLWDDALPDLANRRSCHLRQFLRGVSDTAPTCC